MTKKAYVWGAIVIVVLGLAGWIIGHKLADKKTAGTGDQAAADQSQTENQAVIPENAWLGTLRESDSKSRGNLMLEWQTGKPPVYINTSRDFSQFIGREVIVTFEGDQKEFRLLDIQAK